MTHVVVVGAGIGGVPAAYSLKAQLGIRDRVTVVSDREYFHFVPSNPWVAMGWREQGDIAFPIGPYLAEHGIDFVAQAARRVDVENKRLELDDGSVLPYDYLLLATGIEGDFDEIEGMRAYTHSVLHIEQAAAAHQAYRQFVRQPGPIVVGAVQGSSILGPVYEFAFLADVDLRRRNVRERVPITLVTPEPYPGHLGLGEEGETRRLLGAVLRERGIQVVANARTLKVGPGPIHVMECDADGNDKQAHQLPFAYSVYWPAPRGVAAVRNTPGLGDRRGLIPVDDYLRSPVSPHIFAVGACVAHPAVAKTPLPVGAPDSVYCIQNQANTAVYNILAAIRGEAPASAVPIRAKWLADMGENGAHYLSEPQIPLRNIQWLKQGKWVYQAKVDFEKYFLNKIKLKPAGRIASLASHIATLISQAQAQKTEGILAPPTLRAVTRHLEVALAEDLFDDLCALAQVLERDSNTFASELLGAAIKDAKSHLSEANLEDMQAALRALLVAELPERQPGVEFVAGGT